MLDAVQRHGALRWLWGDWLLENGFYRPISSLSIALDYTLYGEASWGFRLTNWLLMALTALGAWALARAYARLVGSPHADWLALGVGVALSLQQTGLTGIVAKWSAWWFVAAAVGVCISITGWARHSRVSGFQLLLMLGALFWGFDRLLGTEYTRLITWVPSRTALLGALFSVWAMYALVQGATQRRGWQLALGGGLYLLALGSYEQPIALVPLVGALAFWRRRDWGGWGARAFATVALGAALILALRFALLPAEPTTYQRQQLRSSLSGPIFSYLTELLPPTGQWQYWRSVGTNLEVLLVDRAGWDHLAGTLLYLGVLTAAWRWRGLLGGAWLWHALAFLPMAFLHPFEHYMYLPQLGKTLFDVGLIAWGLERLGTHLRTAGSLTGS
ncbi:MAG: hypothetical protein KatS3mg018_1331 [Fimbriimonadales bacterium]|nr:MAG: hypothetical protein KatS3mg018_1331 [Fimbriimonadales bacterium]